MSGTDGADYTERLEQKSAPRWKRLLNVQAPYRWHLRRQRLGRTLDVGCGIGRNLSSLSPGSVGIDHNETSVAAASARGLTAMTVDAWRASPPPHEAFDGLLFAHIVEHMEFREAVALVNEYLPCLRPGGRAFFICPQERGYTTDATHVTFTTGEDLEELARTVGLIPDRWRSFPFPRAAGRVFAYNEFTLLAHKPGQAPSR